MRSLKIICSIFLKKEIKQSYTNYVAFINEIKTDIYSMKKTLKSNYDIKYQIFENVKFWR